MIAHAVIGANYGDEGKGLMTDYLCRKYDAHYVVRFNGGAQAGHTVVLPDGARHIFSHFGSGTLMGATTFLSRFFVCNPVLFASEMAKLPCAARVYVDPHAQVTTPWDMLVNQALETQRGDARHGSCGVGFNETITRASRGYPLMVGDLYGWNLEARIVQIVLEYLPKRCEELGIVLAMPPTDVLIDRFIADCDAFRNAIYLGYAHELLHDRRVVFEGAQGLLLDQDHMNYPYVTRSSTGLRNAMTLAAEAGLDLTPVYVTRTYLTRHGAGPLPTECTMPEHVVDSTNLPHPFQGKLRFGTLDRHSLLTRINADARKFDAKLQLAMTWCDAFPAVADGMCPEYLSYGPTFEDVRQAQPARATGS